MSMQFHMQQAEENANKVKERTTEIQQTKQFKGT